eukprot:1152402-Pelagomonas_calceolata.AAC.5
MITWHMLWIARLAYRPVYLGGDSICLQVLPLHSQSAALKLAVVPQSVPVCAHRQQETGFLVGTSSRLRNRMLKRRDCETCHKRR